ncbi:MAG: polyprenol phosphomannose-dependent alpha 1,6 mannosyltransferase MptB [Actinomycetota bacterium]|nr:polyprenol phosphomannose-dependent alpha 1,6 mannosyltransferase MptB [Actinomycetota bacterium]
MSAPGPFGATSPPGTIELTARALDARATALRAPRLRPVGARSRVNPAALALGGVLLCALLISVGAANTDLLLPESVRPVPNWLAGPFGSTGLGLGVLPLVGIFTLMFVCYVLAVRGADRLSPRLVLMTIAALHAVILLAPPMLSTDVFSYQAYAKIWALYGANPYLHGPHAIALDPLYPFIGAKWVNTPSAYGPAFTALSYPFAHLSIAASALAYKAIAALASLVTVALVWNSARLRGLNPTRAAALVALNPLVVVYGVGGGHNDLLMLALLMAGVYALLGHSHRAAGAFPVLAAAVKLTAGVFLPFMVASASAPGLGARSRRRSILIGASAAAIPMVVLGFAAFGTGQLNLLATLQRTQGQGDWHSIPGFISTSLGLGTVGHIAGVCLAVVFVCVFFWLVRKVGRGEMDWIDGAGWTAVALLITAGSMLPWYVAWLMPFAALGTDRRLWRASLIVSGVVGAIQLVGYVPHTNPLLWL